MTYTDESLYFYIDVYDTTNNEDDEVSIIFNENKDNTDLANVTYITINNENIKAINGNDEELNSIDAFFKRQDYGYSIEVKIPWSYKNEIKQYDSFGFDCYIFNEKANKNYKSIVAFNDISISYDLSKIGEIYFI